MAKIAVVDLVFNFPPNGGASTDLYGIISRLKEDHDIKLFLPKHDKIKISSEFDIPYKQVNSTYFGYNYKKFPIIHYEYPENFYIQ